MICIPCEAGDHEDCKDATEKDFAPDSPEGKLLFAIFKTTTVIKCCCP